MMTYPFVKRILRLMKSFQSKSRVYCLKKLLRYEVSAGSLEPLTK